MENLLAHRSIRVYKNKPVDQQLINEILEAGIRASNTGNMQVYSIVISTLPELIERLAPCHFNQPASKAPVQLTFCVDFNRFTKWCKQRKAEPSYDNFLAFFTGATDALLAAQNVCIAAESKGLGICYLGTTVYNAEKIIEILELPTGVVPIVTLVMGYPDEQPGLTDRLPLEAVVHNETYHDYSEDAINRLYAEKESSSLTKELLEINKKETLAQIFTDNRYSKKLFVDVSRTYLEVLKKQGFMNQ
ncbi:MAG: nitroreductase family protein [Prevotellaceae bacterium]|jgi:nitroreductase|nr:nitroreductase family protein [Prevotellaceae bacterium]